MSRPDQHLRWAEYQEPRTAVAALLQQPAYKITAEALASAYMADYRKEKRNASR